MHIGQHGPSGLDWVKEQKLATAKEYMQVKTELQSIGYVLRVLNP